MKVIPQLEEAPAASPILHNRVLGFWADRVPQEASSISPQGLWKPVHKAEGPHKSVAVFASPATTVQVHSAEGRPDLVVWGTLGHPAVEWASLPGWILDRLSEGSVSDLENLTGCFVLLVVDRRHAALTVVTDAIGVRPFFYSTTPHGVVFGSSVFDIQGSGWASSRLDFDAIATWLAYGYNSTDGSLFDDIKRFSPASVTSLNEAGTSTRPYLVAAQTTAGEPPDVIAEEVHRILGESFDSWTSDGSFVCALSGGFDSRYILALAQSRGKRCTAITVASDAAEVATARDVAGRLGVPWEIVPVRDSLVDVYGDPFHFTPDGFPIGKQETMLVARARPGAAIANGFLGDNMLRASHSRCLGKRQEEHSSELAAVMRTRHLAARLDLLRSAAADHVHERVLAPMHRAVARWEASGKLFSSFDLYYRQRFFMANNFVQHLHSNEPILPFLDARLVRYFLDHDDRCFGEEVYEHIFRERFPALWGVPHASRRNGSGAAEPRPSRLARDYSLALIRRLSAGKGLALFRRAALLSRVGAVLAGRSSLEYVALYAHKVALLEAELERRGISVDWGQL